MKQNTINSAIGAAILTIALALPSAASAQPSRPPQLPEPVKPAGEYQFRVAPARLALTLQQAQEYALQHNRTIENASIDVVKAEAAKWQAISSMLPQVSSSVDYSNNFGYKMDLGGFSISMPAYASLGITTAMGFSGAQIVSLQVADISRRMADISLHKTEQDICDQVRVLYYSALVTEESLKLLEKNLESLDKLYDMSLKSVEVGVAEQTDADQILVQASTMRNTIASTRRSLEMVYNSMRLQMNIDPSTEIILLQDLGNLVNAESAAELASEEFDIERNYDYRLLRESTELARKQIALTGWSNGPTLRVYHQYNTRKYFSDEARMNMTPPNMFGAQLNIPLFTSGKNYTAVKDARLAYRKQLNTLEDTELALKVQHRQLVYNLKSALERCQTQKQSVEVAQRVFDNIALKYEHGVASSMDVTNSGTSLIAAQSNYVQALMEMVNAQISLEQLLNR
ncbi:MAG: TolC family protein [Bacteroidales bacterium]|nr:TolC family protein [Bacteroidales bacterium]